MARAAGRIALGVMPVLHGLANTVSPARWVPSILALGARRECDLLRRGRRQFEILYAVTIAAPPDKVWPWLVAFQLPHFIMPRRMMLTIKTLAETHA